MGKAWKEELDKFWVIAMFYWPPGTWAEIHEAIDEQTTVLDLKRIMKDNPAYRFEMNWQVVKLDPSPVGRELEDGEVLMTAGVKKWGYVHVFEAPEVQHIEEEQQSQGLPKLVSRNAEIDSENQI
jgi:hypothetical protein